MSARPREGRVEAVLELPEDGGEALPHLLPGEVLGLEGEARIHEQEIVIRDWK